MCYLCHTQAFNAPDDLPKTVARTLNHGSSPLSMDFHPVQQTLLLVGTNVGDIGLWEVGSREKLVLKNFKVWNLSACSMPFQAALVKDPAILVNCVIWSPDGSLFGNVSIKRYSFAIEMAERNERNSSGKAIAGVLPQLWLPSSGILMTNDVAETNPEESVACFALSKNDSYVMSASGGKVSLFNMMTFKVTFSYCLTFEVKQTNCPLRL
ncbi:putative transcription factor WD40-like family [Helianthus anomalus]